MRTAIDPVKPLQIRFLEPRAPGQSTFPIPPRLRTLLYSDRLSDSRVGVKRKISAHVNLLSIHSIRRVVIETQLRCGKLELEAAKNALEKAELNLNDKIEQLIEIDIEKSTLLLKSLELKEDNLSLLNVNQVKEALVKVKTSVLESFNKESELDFYKDDSFKTNKLYIVIRRAKASLDLSRKTTGDSYISDFTFKTPWFKVG